MLTSCLNLLKDMKETRADFVIEEHQSLWFTPQFKAIQRNSLKQKLKTNEAAKLSRNQYGKLSFGAGEGRFLREGMCL